MIGLLSALPMLPQVLQEKIIDSEVNHARLQSDYFKTRTRTTDEIIRPEIYIPVFEPEEATLVAVFVEPGAAHLVFKDEVAPTTSLDERYREARLRIFGRSADVESVEFESTTEVLFTDNYSGVQPYETSMHFASVLPYKGAIYSNTWNHLLNVVPCAFIRIRGGYKKMEVPMVDGNRAAAEEWAMTIRR